MNGSWAKVPSSFDSVSWQLNHTALLNDTRDKLQADGYTVKSEKQNFFNLPGRCATIGGKPDLVAVRGNEGLIIDTKSGQPRDSHIIQVMLYMYAISKVTNQHEGVTFTGRVTYPDHEVDVPATAVDEAFIGRMAELVKRLASENPAVKAPSYDECQWCEISVADCPQRVEKAEVLQGMTDDF